MSRKSSTGTLKTKTIRVCVTEAEHQYIRDCAGALSMSAYLLAAAIQRPVPEQRRRLVIPEINRLAYLELGKIQQALQHIVDSGQQALMPSFPDADALQHLNNQIDALRLGLIGVNDETLQDEEWLV